MRGYTFIVSTVSLDDVGLRVWVAHCAAVAGQLADPIAPAGAGPAGQATATAARDADAAVDAATAVLATRVQAMGAKAVVATSGYLGTENNSAQRVAALAVPPAV